MERATHDPQPEPSAEHRRRPHRPAWAAPRQAPEPLPPTAQATGSHPDAELVRNASRRIGVRVALVCTALVLGGASVFFGYLWWRSGHPEAPDRSDVYQVTIDLDMVDLVTAAVLAGAVAIGITWIASVLFARSAVAPLGEALRRQREFVSNASHELRTPLTVLSARTQLLQATMSPEDRARPMVDELRRDTDAMAQIVTDMLSLARLDAAPEGTCRLDHVAEETCRDLDLLDPERGVRLVSDTEPVVAAIPDAAVGRMLTALVDNALGFAPPETEVRVSVGRSGQSAQVRVRDHGAGIQGLRPDTVFDRFSRGRPTAVPGSAPGAAPRASHGVGLALVRQTARRYGGDATVESTGPEGTVMLLTLPVGREEKDDDGTRPGASGTSSSGREGER